MSKARSSKSNNWLYFMFYCQEEYAFIFSWNVIFWPSGTPSSVVQTKVAAWKFRKMSCIWLLDPWIWPMSSFGLASSGSSAQKCLILYDLENNPMEQVSKAARSAQPKSITVCIHFHLTHLHHQIFGRCFQCLFFTVPELRLGEKLRRRRGEYLLG